MSESVILNKEKQIKKIIHISDIHIRKNRHEEYKEIFQKFYDEIQKYDLSSLLVVITGDIFHEGFSSENIVLCRDFYSTICENVDVINIIGNHDVCSRTNVEKTDFLSSALYKLKTKNTIHHLTERGTYIYGNLAFGLTTMMDNSVFNIEENTDKIKIGLYHGSINGSKTDDGFTMSNTGKFNVSDFDSYNYIMLGDIHKWQYLNKKKNIWYASSLLQQNFGESIENHGYVLLDVDKKTTKYCHIKNRYGFVTIYIKNNKILKQDYDFPEKTNLRLKYEDTTTEFISQTIAEVGKKTEIISCKYEHEMSVM